MILQAQFLHSCPPDLSVFLKQQAPMDLKSMGEMANRFLSSAPSTAKPRSSCRSARWVPRQSHPYRPTVYQGEPVRPFQCSRFPAPQPMKCTLCDQLGHWQNQCKQRVPKVTSRLAQTVNAAITPVTHHDSTCPSSSNFRCRCAAPGFGNACIRDCHGLKVHRGAVNGCMVDVLRHPGVPLSLSEHP